MTNKQLDRKMRFAAPYGMSEKQIAGEPGQWRSEILGMPYQETAEEKALRRAIVEYRIAAEQFDRSICTGGVDARGNAVPDSLEQRIACNWNAQRLRKKLEEDWSHIPRAVFQEALHRNTYK